MSKRTWEGKQITKWWEHMLLYQIYPRSFKDSTGNGTGDIKGIISMIDYLVNLGIDALWLSPIYKSPMVDFGYDISDYTEIDPIFGVMKDFEMLTSKAHNKGLRVVMDFVPNHSSNKHDWFIKSELREGKYADYYIWRDAKDSFKGDKEVHAKEKMHIPPNNWVSVFRNSAWTWSEKRQQFYYHAFAPEQPDLNYRNPDVLEEMKKVVEFWVFKGVDGFRMDAVPFLFVDQEFRDEPKSNKTNDPDNYMFLDHIHTFNLPAVFDILNEFKISLEKLSKDQVVMVEALSGDLTTKDLMKYHTVADFSFNFNFICHLNSPLTGDSLEKEILDWMDNLPPRKSANWVLGNHDVSRVGSRFGPECIEGLSMVSLLLPGVAVTYQGEEIGMTDTDVTFEETVDPAGLNYGASRYKEGSRDPVRTPMQWNTDNFAGFSNGEKTWLPVNQNYKTGVTVKGQQIEEESHLKVYQELAHLRKLEVFKIGKLKCKGTKEVFVFSRCNKDITYIVAFNVSKKEVILNVDGLMPKQTTARKGRVIVRSAHCKNEKTKLLSSVDLDDISLYAHEAIVFKILVS